MANYDLTMVMLNKDTMKFMRPKIKEMFIVTGIDDRGNPKFIEYLTQKQYQKYKEQKYGSGQKITPIYAIWRQVRIYGPGGLIFYSGFCETYFSDEFAAKNILQASI